MIIVMDLGNIVKGAVEKHDMLGWQFNTIGVSDAITMGGEGNSPLFPSSPLPSPLFTLPRRTQN